MFSISTKFIVFKNEIINKKTGKKYILPDSLVKYLKFFPRDNLIPSQFLEYLKINHIVEESDNLYNPFLKQTFLNNQRLFIQLTGRCNLFCKHCFLSEDSCDKEWFDINKVKKLINIAIENGIWRIDFTGGEISILPWLKELIEYLDSKPISYSLFSNLVIQDELLINAIKNAQGLREIITSVDYFDEYKHDSFRGKKGAFRLTMKNIQSLHEKKVNLSVNTMILPDNHEDIIMMIDYFYPLRIYMCLDTIVKKGRAEKNPFFSWCFKESIDFIIHCSKYIKNKYGYSMDFIGNVSCGVGKSLLYIDKNGDFQLCPGLTAEDDSSFYLGKNIDIAIKKREEFDLTCKEKCLYHDICSYGCREKAFVQYGELNSRENSLCYLLSEVH